MRQRSFWVEFNILSLTTFLVSAKATKVYLKHIMVYWLLDQFPGQNHATKVDLTLTIGLNVGMNRCWTLNV